ncbi:dorsal-ventral patterning protein tolloid [Ciona intestinalis]
MTLCCSVLQVYEGTNLLGEVRGQGSGVTFTSTGTNLTVKFTYYPDFIINATYKEIYWPCPSDQTPAPMITPDLNQAWNYNEENTTPEPMIITDQQGCKFINKYLRQYDCMIMAYFMEQSFLRNINIYIYYTGKCGFHVQANKSRQQINSPGYETNSYSNNLDCEWIITTNPKKPVRLVIESFSTEACCDYLQILDGNTVIATLQGLHPSRSVYTSTDGILKLRFYSDGSVVRRGFIGFFYEVQTPSPNDDRETTQYINAACGFNATATANPQTLNSPGYPEKYENNMFCTWRLAAQEGKQVKLTVGRFITESVDVLLIYDGDTLIQTLSGTHLQWLQHFYSTTRELIVVFRSNPYLTFSGFSSSFIEIDE